MPDDETQQCPYCAETIKKEAKICRFCQMDLSTGKSFVSKNASDIAPKEIKAKSGVKDGVKLGCGMFIVLPIIILLLIIAAIFFIPF